MSGPIWRLIGPARTRLQHYVEEASSLLSFLAKEETVEEDETRVEEVICHINMNISLLESCNREWVGLLKDLKGKEKVKGEKEHQKAAEGSKVYIEVLLDANEVVTHLQTQLKVIAKRKEQS